MSELSSAQKNSHEKQLAAAFDLFNQMSNSLGQSYRELESRVAELSRQLAVERSARFSELAAKEGMADRLSALLRVLPAGVVILDRQDVVIEVNPRAEKMLATNRSQTSLIGQKWDAAIGDRIAARVNRTRGDTKLRLDNGTYVVVSERVQDADGNTVVLLTDVSESHALEVLINRETRLTALGEMAARLAHQLRTPISSALLYSSHLVMPELDGGDRRRLGDKISERLRHLDELVHSMLQFVKGQPITFQRFHLAEFLEELEGVLRSALQEKSVGRLSVSHHLDCPIAGDRQALLSAAINVAENAIQLIDDPHLYLSTQVIGNNAVIRIRDNGPGVAADVIDDIFDPFYTTRVDGTGLGLAIADATLRDHGGSLCVRNTESGGAEFTLTIPRGEHTADQY